MKKIGEQWIEEISGVKHMIKLLNIEYDAPPQFTFNKHGIIILTRLDEEKQTFDRLSYKDLGIVNEDGCLPSPWGGYPKIIHEVNQTRIENGEDVHYDNLWCVEIHEPVLVCTDEYLTEQEAIDAWNRRAM